MESKTNTDETFVDFTRNIKYSGLKTSLKLVKTIFGDITENKVTFCFDYSGSMYRVYHHLREHLLEALFKMLISNRGQKFNIVLFNSSVHQFSSRHINCVQENIINVIKWMNKGYYESKTNILEGIIKAFDDLPDAVYLVTDGFINKDRTRLLSRIPHITKGRPIKVIMITHKYPPDSTALDFLEDLVTVSYGSLSIILVEESGSVEVVMPIIYTARPPGYRRAIFNPFQDEVIDLAEIRKYFRCQGCHVREHTKKALDGDPMADLPVIAPFIDKDQISRKRCPFYHPFYHWYWPQFWEGNGPSPTLMWTKNDPQYHSMWSDFRDSRAFICGQKYLDLHNNVIRSVSASTLLMNRKVLAFNHEDKYKFYLGKVIQQVTSRYFLILFDVNKEFLETQKTEIHEIIDFEEQKRYSIDTDDYVIAPLDSTLGVYEIGKVKDGNESRYEYSDLIPMKNSILKVHFLQSDVEKVVEFNQAIFISPILKEKFEHLQNMLRKESDVKGFSRLKSDSESDCDNHNDNNNNDNNGNGNNNNNKYGRGVSHDESDSTLTMQNNCCCGFCKWCCGPRLKPRAYGRIASVDSKARTIKEIDREILERKLKSDDSNHHDANKEYEPQHIRISINYEIMDESSEDQTTKYDNDYETVNDEPINQHFKDQFYGENVKKVSDHNVKKVGDHNSRKVSDHHARKVSDPSVRKISFQNVKPNNQAFNEYDDQHFNFDNQRNQEEVDDFRESMNETEFKSSGNYSISKTDNEERTERGKAYTDADINSSILRRLYRPRKSNSIKKDDRSWKYWGKKPIPDVISPPSTGPYQEPNYWSKSVPTLGEWPTANTIFNVFNHQTQKQDAKTGTDGIRFDKSSVVNYEKNIKSQEGNPEKETKCPCFDSIRPLLSPKSSANLKKDKAEQVSKPVEDYRINSQIQRDELNCVNYLCHKNNA